MFIPSESVYADLHERFDDIVQKAHRAGVMIVSPTLMVLAIQVVKQIRKDAAMREAADQIRTEVGHMMKDVGLLERPRAQICRGISARPTRTSSDILISTGKIEKRGDKIEDVEFDDATSRRARERVIPAPIRKLGSRRIAHDRLRPAQRRRARPSSTRWRSTSSRAC